MIIPIRCFSCGKPVGHLWDQYQEKVQSGTDEKDALDQLGLNRYCCRSVLLGHVELADTAAAFKKH